MNQEQEQAKHREGQFKCPSCNEFCDREDSEYTNISKRSICSGCRESDREHASTMLRFLNGEKETVKFGDENGYYIDSTGDYDDYDLPDWFNAIFEKREYVHTDGWRGYNDTKFKGLTKLADGWLTGYPDSTKPERKAVDLYQSLSLGSLETPKPIYWLFEPTSNIYGINRVC